MTDGDISKLPHLDQILALDDHNQRAFVREHQGELAVLRLVSQELERLCSLPCPADHRMIMLMMVHIGHRHLLATWRSLASLHAWDSAASLRLVVELASHLAQIAHDPKKAEVWLHKASDPKGKKIAAAFSGGKGGDRWDKLHPDHREAFKKAWNALSELAHSNFRASTSKVEIDAKTGRYSFRFHDDPGWVRAQTRWVLRLGLAFTIEAHLSLQKAGLQQDPAASIGRLRRVGVQIESTPTDAALSLGLSADA
jgi:hypothetical protein